VCEDREGILSRWAEHFHGVLNQPSTFDPSVLDAIPDWNTAHGLMEPPDINEVQRAVNQMASGKAPGSDGLPPELFKSEGPVIIDKLLSLYTSIWSARDATPEIQRCPDRSHIQEKRRPVSLRRPPWDLPAINPWQNLGPYHSQPARAACQ